MTSRYRYIAEWSPEHDWGGPETITLTPSRDARGAAVLTAVGVLDVASAPLFARATAALPAGVPVHLDLGGLTFIDSCGLRALLVLVEHHGSPVTFTPSPALDRLIELLGLSTLARARVASAEPAVLQFEPDELSVARRVRAPAARKRIDDLQPTAARVIRGRRA
jgi:anti-anti-sigma factor